MLGARATICSLHFEQRCFRYGAVNGKALLKEGSVLSLHLQIKGIIN